MRLIIGLTEHIGDIVACEPVSRYLRDKYPDAQIDWAVFDKYRELIDTNPYIDETITVGCLTDWIKITKHAAYDEVIDLHVNYRVCPHCNIPLIKEHGNPFVNVYQWFDYGALLEAFSQGAGLPRISGQPKLYLNDEHIQAVNILNLKNDYFVIHRKSNDFRKDYIDEYWLRIVEVIIAETGMIAVEIGTLGEEVISPLGDRVIDLRDKTSILQSAEVIRRSKFFIGVDSGPAHMANALFVPGIVLLGKYHVFRRYNPFTGFYASTSPCVKIVRNELGPVRELALNDIIESVRYVISNLECKNTPAHDMSANNIVVGQPKNDSGSNYILPNYNVDIDFRQDIYEQTSHNSVSGEPRIFAFYLPQFHPIAENNKGHRPGFTEWDNVIASKPLFRGHYQPRTPGELGYYDLRSIEVMRDQVRLANDHGISGFCFYYYYFQGRRLLHTPIDNYIASDIKAPFFFLWANENWTRRWDGGDNELIVSQNHSDEDDLVFIRGLLKTFSDDRYVKIDGMPILMIYKTHLFPNIRRSTDLWRNEVVKHGFAGLYIIKVDDWTTEPTIPQYDGCDASYEIPSNVVPTWCEIKDFSSYDIVDDFQGRIVDYRSFASFHIGRPEPAYKRFRTVMAPWDNTPRYGTKAMVHVNHDNDSYKLWMTSVLLSTYERFQEQERIVFLHSWNEWCEGTYVEPDGQTGRRRLEETREALADVRALLKRKHLPGTLKEDAIHYRVLKSREEGALRIILNQASDLANLRGNINRVQGEYHAFMESIYASKSWRLTKPLRFFMRNIKLMSRKINE